ncbi:glycosyltransferase family 2 protein [Sutcliffiella sp. NC1]|uniref:glycosyltransferase family 2 protein n=1 Tax=Sutcliffiella sp. NC1 TaxID=3004096 RepID=UPI0022DD9C4A|nr:glycosyltransferase family 2 protein [Sutcliffiella sp. NC1]WBL14538.1 glycosyltransferase family 2 protein [Sutcliffiella sp. NC1]
MNNSNEKPYDEDQGDKLIKVQEEFKSITNRLAVEEENELELLQKINELEKSIFQNKDKLNRATNKKSKSKKRYEKISTSTSWRITAPVRKFLDKIKGKGPKYEKTSNISDVTSQTGARENNKKEEKNEVRYLDKKLWAGFSKYAIKELSDIKYSSEHSKSERVKAARAIARWEYDNNRYEKALENLYFVDEIRSSSKINIDAVIREIKVLKKLGQEDLALRELWKAIDGLGMESELCLAMAHVHDDLSERIKWINLIFEKYGYKNVQKRDADQELTLHNVRTKNLESIDNFKDVKVSVIIPAYKAEDSIHIALNGLLEQSHSNIEIIVVDDCSPDNTAEVVSRYTKIDNRVKLIKKTNNEGAYAARNTALDYVTGDYVTIHDSDDWSHSQKIEVQLRALMNSQDAVGTISHLIRVYNDLSPVNAGSLLSTKFLIINSSSLLVHKNVFKELGGWDNVRVGGDTEFIRRIEKVYGSNSIIYVEPKVPFSFSLSDENSLTGTSATHIKTIRYGLRRTYRESYQWWHDSIGSNKDLYIEPGSSERKFPCPVPNLVKKPTSRDYDYVFIADFTIPLKEQSFYNILNKEIRAGKKIAIFHWAFYENDVYKLLSYEVYDMAHKYNIDILVPGEKVFTQLTIIGTPHVLNYSVDSAPEIESKNNFVVYSDDSDKESLPSKEENIKNVFGFEVKWVQQTQIDEIEKQ